MKLIGFNFNKISAERIKDLSGNLKFNTKIEISSVEPLKSDFLRIKDDIIKVDFVYLVLYEPDFAKINLEGSILISTESRQAREILKDWKDKKVSDEFKTFAFNIILRKSNIRTLQLEEELNLPPHIPLPSLSKEKKNDEKDNK